MIRRRILAATVLCIAATAAATAADPKVLSPRHLSTAIGPTEILVDPGAPDRQIARVEITVNDGAPIVLTAPPWQGSFDAGDASRGHRIDVVVHLRDGSQATASARTSALRINQYEDVDLVNVFALVRDRGGRYVGDLAQSDFRVLEDGRPQTIRRFSRERKPLHVAIVLDTSRTMQGRKLEKARDAAIEFVRSLEPGDQAMLVNFSDRVRVVHDLTSDFAALEAAIQRSEVTGGTALYDAIFRAARRLDKLGGRRVMVLLSDGRDEAANGLEPGSLHTLQEALVQALRSETMIFAIGLGRNLHDELDFYRTRSLRSILTELADSTGGRALISSSPGELRRAFRTVSEDLGAQYAIGYQSDDERAEGQWREIKLLTPARKGLEVITRKGYYAPGIEREGATDAEALPTTGRPGA